MYEIHLFQSRYDVVYPKEHGNINACSWSNCMRAHKNSRPPVTGEERKLRANSYIYEKHLKDTLDFSYYNMGTEVFYETVLPALKRFHFGKLRAIDLSYNNLDTQSIEKFLSCLPEPDK